MFFPDKTTRREILLLGYNRQVQCKEVQVLTPTSDTERSSEQSWVSPDASGLFFIFIFCFSMGMKWGEGGWVKFVM